ncbi:Hypothetical predicted protein [Lecanosticta acicola]|uniref:DUF3074 domain-containing protein n=1 Tax=Lecanosticta acicola TaxID=111012 RepID=A0AAI8YXH7_9PEZI|nr:Hypothetical predicted protein [Lecanosticta acicola]
MSTDATSAPPALGSYIRMRPLKPAELPAHPTLAPLQEPKTAPSLKAFISTVLNEGNDFVTDYLPKAFKVKARNRAAPPSTAPVELLEHEISAHDLPEDGRTMGASETWFARESIHENAAQRGTASWEEFDSGLRADHSQHEMDYTPDVLDAHIVCDWKAELEQLGGAVDGWNDVDFVLMEMMHKIPWPLNNRAFPVVVLTAKRAQEFIVVQVPVAVGRVKEARYAKESKVVTGTYCSIERCEAIEGGTKVKWQMATASNAKGNLPMSLQKLGTPPAIVKDVGLFMDWCEKRRGEK